MKSHLKKIKRTFDYTDKSQYNYVLNQSERSEQISNVMFEIFKKQLKQEDFMYYPNKKTSKKSYVNFIM